MPDGIVITVTSNDIYGTREITRDILDHNYFTV